MGHHHNKCHDKPRKFHDKVGKGTIDSTPVLVPPDFNTETGTVSHPGPFVGQVFHPSSQQFYGLMPRRNTPNRSPEKAGKILMDDKKHGDDRFYKPRVKNIHRNLVKT